MKTVEQKVVRYTDYVRMHTIESDMNKYIEDGWLVNNCFSHDGEVIVIYQRDLESWN